LVARLRRKMKNPRVALVGGDEDRLEVESIVRRPQSHEAVQLPVKRQDNNKCGLGERKPSMLRFLFIMPAVSSLVKGKIQFVLDT